MKIKRVIALLCAVGMIALLMSGCSQNKSENPSEAVTEAVQG